MAMKTCKECGKSVSTRAKYCPHCGTDKPRQGSIGGGSGLTAMGSGRGTA